MAETLNVPKATLLAQAGLDLARQFADIAWTGRQKLAIACRILHANGVSSGLAGQVTARVGEDRYYTQRLGLGLEEITTSNLLLVDQDLNLVEGEGMPNPANRFHTWIYRARPDVNCIIHTHPLHAAALSMLGVPLEVSHMDNMGLYEDCAHLPEWPGIPFGNEEGEIISAALGDKRAILLAHHGLLVAAPSIEQACTLTLTFERAAAMQLLAMSAGTIRPIRPQLGREAHDWLATQKRASVGFAYYARRTLLTHGDVLDE